MTRRCPQCRQLNDDNNWTCSGCGSQIQDEKIVLKVPEITCKSLFTIEIFFKDNFHLFTIIGVIGTMIALLPNLGEKIIGYGWLESDYKILPIVFAIFIFAGGLLIFVAFSVLIGKIWKDYATGESIKQKIALTIILFLMTIGTFYFILQIILFIPNYQVFVLSILFSIILLIVFIAYTYYCFFIDQYHTIKSLSKQNLGIFKCIVYAIVFLIFCYLVGNFIGVPIINFFFHPSDPHDVAILTDQEIYSPKISTTVGLELFPTNSTNFKSFYPNYNTTGFRWETNYGFFVTQDPYTSKTFLLDNYTVRHSTDKVFWSFSESDIPKDKSPIQIKLKIYLADGNNWTPFTNTSLNLTWTDQQFARVEDFANHSIGSWTVFHPFMISD